MRYCDMVLYYDTSKKMRKRMFGFRVKPIPTTTNPNLKGDGNLVPA
jgi:hypothetical protein